MTVLKSQTTTTQLASNTHKLAFMEANWRRLRRDKAVIIQCFIRQYLSRVELARLREERRILERDMSTRIQANARYHMWMEEGWEVIEVDGTLRNKALLAAHRRLPLLLLPRYCCPSPPL